MPKQIQISDRTHRRVIRHRDELAISLDRKVTITELIDAALDAYEKHLQETKDAPPKGTGQ